MTRQKKEDELRSQVIRVREYCGTYIATGGGKRASCSAGPFHAADALAFKLFRDTPFILNALHEPNTFRALAREAV